MEMNAERLRTNGTKGRFRAATPKEMEAIFDFGYVAIPESGCWVWMGDSIKSGYGVMAGKRYAHRYSFERFRGPIPEGLHVLHRCDVPCCVNPNHFFLGTQRDNNNDKMAKGRASGGSMKGEAHPQAKLTPGQVLQIRKLIDDGGNQTRVGKMFGISQGQVWHIANRKSWKHL